MDWNQIIMVLLSTTIPAVLTYFVTSKNNKQVNDAKIKEIEAIHKLEVQKIESSHKLKLKEMESTIEQLKLEHSNQIEKMRVEYEIQKSTSNDTMGIELASKLLTGELDLTKMVDSVDKIIKIKDAVEKSNTQGKTSNFLKKQ